MKIVEREQKTYLQCFCGSLSFQVISRRAELVTVEREANRDGASQGEEVGRVNMMSRRQGEEGLTREICDSSIPRAET